MQRELGPWKLARNGDQIELARGNADPEIAVLLGEVNLPDGRHQWWLDRRLHEADDRQERWAIYGALTTVIEWAA